MVYLTLGPELKCHKGAHIGPRAQKSETTQKLKNKNSSYSLINIWNTSYHVKSVQLNIQKKDLYINSNVDIISVKIVVKDYKLVISVKRKSKN